MIIIIIGIMLPQQPVILLLCTVQTTITDFLLRCEPDWANYPDL